MRITYAPGDWAVIVRSGTLIVLPPDTRHAIISSIWESLAESRNLEMALRAVTKAFDGDVMSMPPFAIASLQSRLHVMVRGQITIRSRSNQAETDISGIHVTTWNEQVLHDQDSLDIRFEETASGEPVLPLESGVVRAAGMAISLIDPGPGTDRADRPGVGEQASASAAVPDRPAASDAVPDQPDRAPTAVPDQPPSTSGGDETMSPADLDGIVEDDEAGDVPSESIETAKFSQVDESSNAGDDASSRSEPVSSRPDLIASVPWAEPRRPSSSATGSNPVRPETESGESSEASAPPDHESSAPAEDEYDHDGHTVMRSGLNPAQPAASSPDGTDATKTPGPSTAPIVLARICPSGHANPPTNSHCTTCGATITAEPGEARRPSLGSMRMSNGEVVELDRSVIVGRQPSMSRVQGNVMPRMVQVRSDEGDISRSHVEVQLEGWHVMLRDLNSTNGTFLVREGQPPRRLAQGEQTMLLDGDIAKLGDDVWLRFEDLK
ncbi:FHA domain-containing protein [Arthrobacter pigmenti]